jgi:leucyl/phenylalanyl-tRNA---protein transferase
MKQVVWLKPDTFDFPPVEDALEDPPGLLAAGGDLDPERLLAAYAAGIFPWYDNCSPILWWSPDPRMVMQPHQVHVSRSLRKRLRHCNYRISMDEAFAQVISSCAGLREQREGTWIVADMQAAYTRLHELGHAHSVEVWDKEQLVGGLYGVSLGSLFFGESMFSLVPGASKIAFVALARQLQHWSFQWIDCQMPTKHLQSMGAYAMSRDGFQEILSRWRANGEPTGRWEFDCKVMEIE